MEAGYDYTLLGQRPQSNAKYLPALFVAVLAGVILISGLAYYGFAADAEVGHAATAATAGEAAPVSGTSDGSEIPAVKYTRRLAPASADAIAGQELYPSGLSEAQYWVNPLGYEQ